MSRCFFLPKNHLNPYVVMRQRLNPVLSLFQYAQKNALKKDRLFFLIIFTLD